MVKDSCGHLNKTTIFGHLTFSLETNVFKILWNWKKIKHSAKRKAVANVKIALLIGNAAKLMKFDNEK